jgi:hypothetical protein
VSQVRNHSEHCGCSSDFVVWSSVAWTLKNTRGTRRSILVQASESYVQQYRVLHVKECLIKDYNGGNREILVGDHSMLS